MTRWKCRLCINTAIFHSTAYSCVTRSTGSGSFLWVRVVPASVSRCVHALAIAVPPRHPAGLSSCRGVAISGSPILRRRAAPTGCKVPDGVSHLFPCTAGALFPEANSLLLHPAPYKCPALYRPAIRRGYEIFPRAMRGELPHCSLCIVHCAFLPHFSLENASFYAKIAAPAGIRTFF